MNVTKYRKWYLEENWKNNEFLMLEENVSTDDGYNSIDYQRQQSMVLSGEAFWITDNRICFGYKSRKNPEIFRPIFSHSRQRLLDNVNNNIRNSKLFWNKIKSRYFMELYKIKKLPVDCVNNIVMLTSL